MAKACGGGLSEWTPPMSLLIAAKEKRCSSTTLHICLTTSLYYCTIITLGTFQEIAA